MTLRPEAPSSPALSAEALSAEAPSAEPRPALSAITVSQRDGRVVAIKTAQGADSASRLAREADILGRLDHPGIVQLVEHLPGASGHLATIFVGPDTWDRQPPTNSMALTSRLSVLAGTVADLHDSGVVHGNIALEHIITSSDGRPVLCGLGGARAADPAGIANDHDGLAEVFRAASSQVPGAARTACEGVAAGLARGTTSARGATHQLDELARREPGIDSRLRGHLRFGAISAAIVVSLVLVGWLLSPSGAPSAVVEAQLVPSSIAAATAGADNSVEPAAPPSTEPLPAPGAGAPLLVHGGRQYALGRAGDIVVARDWNCDGIATPALLRTETGEVAIFALWPEPAKPIVADSVTTVVGATGFVIVDDDPCPELRLQTAAGSRLIETSFP